MDKKTLTIVLAVVLIICFFLEILKVAFFGISGYDFVFGLISKEMPAWRFVLLVGPLCGILLLVGAMNNGNYPGGRALLSWLPLLGIVAFTVLFYLEAAGTLGGDMGDDYDGRKSRSVPIGDFIKILGYGYWISLVASLTLAFYNPKPKA